MDNDNYDEFSEEQENTASKKFWKFLVLLLLLNIGFAAVIIRLFSVQVLNAGYYSDLAKRQHESNVPLRANRGNIFDAQGRLLAANIKSYSVAVDPAHFKHKDPKEQKLLNDLKSKICRRLSEATGASASSYVRDINECESRFVWLERGLPEAKISELKNLDIRGLILLEEPKRNYLYDHAGSQVIGNTDIDNRGINGIEKQWDSVLSGQNGYVIMHRDARGVLRPSADLPYKNPIDGNSIQLTIDIDLQRIIEYELKQGVINYEANSGTAIALNPQTGEVLAMASYPGYDPNTYSSNPVGILRNRGVTDTYEPGSTFKIVTAAAALEEDIVDTSDVFNAYKGALEFSEYTIRDDHPLDTVTFAGAVRHSSNIVFAQVAHKIPDHMFYRYMRDFGFGLTLDIDVPGEVKGKMKKPSEYTGASKRFMGHGYGISTTALQIVNAYAAVANDGVLMRPYIVRKILDHSGEAIVEKKPQKIRRVISSGTSELLTELLCQVVDRGTGKNAKIEGMKIAGKTGTSQQLVNGQYSKQNYTASFAGYFPAEDPQVVLIVVLDKPKHHYYGGASAAPVFRNMALRWMGIRNVFTQKETEKHEKKSDTAAVPYICGLSYEEASEVIDEAGLELQDIGDESAVILSQEPSAGSYIKKGSAVKIKVLNEDEQMPVKAEKINVKGLPVRRAMNLLQESNCLVKVRGSGKVSDQKWIIRKNGEKVCLLICK